jgi:ABC-type nitrate/sulfonate/bicarbonate transport system ATPase subunit
MNAAMAWMMLTMVEGLSRSEGGVGVLLLSLQRAGNYPAIFALQVLLLLVGMGQDLAIKGVKAACCPYTGGHRRFPCPTTTYTPSPSPLIEVRNLSVHYDSPILRDVNITINNIVRPGHTQGQVVSILAPSGMGKTQLFRCIAGLKKPDSGEVYLDEQKKVVEAGMVGVVAQDYPLFEHMTVWDNILLAARRKMPASEAKEVAIRLLEHFGLSERRGLYPHQISGGQRQRVAIIQQMVCSNRVLLMDEPFSGLDPIMKTNVQDNITTVAAADELATIMLTTHDVSSSIAVSDHIILLGRDKDEKGNPIPGARVQFTYDLLKDYQLAWRPDIESLPQFHELYTEILHRFREL